MGADNKAVKHSGKSNRALSRPAIMLSQYLNKLLMPIVTGEHSIQMVANFQRMCGLRADGTATNLLLDFYFRLASTAGEEIFSLMPLLFWFMLPVAVPFLTNFLVLQITGQLTKDFFCLPRPVSAPGAENPIIKLDTHFETEYGLPSTHTIAGLLPLTTLLILLRHGVDISTTSWVLSGIYAVSVALSRLYLGVHSVYDVLAGAVMGVGLVSLLHIYGDAIDVLLYQYSGALYVQIVLLCVYLVGYPRSGPWSASFGTAAQMMGPFFGCGISLWYLLNVNHELRDVIMNASVISPRPQLYFPVKTIVDATHTAGASVVGLASTLAAQGNALFLHPAEQWHAFNAHMGAGADGARYHWYNTHPTSFTQLTTSKITYRLIAAAVLAGLAKLLLKIIPSLIFSTLFKLKVIQPAAIHLKDCFDRAVPDAKSYVVEIPVRIINYASLGIIVTLAVPFAWQYMESQGWY